MPSSTSPCASSPPDCAREFSTLDLWHEARRSDMFDCLYATLPGALEAQREMAIELEKGK